MKKIKVDAMGDQCPIPVIKTKKALKEFEPSVDNLTPELYSKTVLGSSSNSVKANINPFINI